MNESDAFLKFQILYNITSVLFVNALLPNHKKSVIFQNYSKLKKKRLFFSTNKKVILLRKYISLNQSILESVFNFLYKSIIVQ